MCSKQIQHDIFGKRYNVKTFNYIDDFKSHKRINFNDKDKDNPIYADTNIDGDNKISDFTDAKIYVTPISAAPKDINIDASYMKDGAKYGEGFCTLTTDHTIPYYLDALSWLNSTQAISKHTSKRTNTSFMW